MIETRCDLDLAQEPVLADRGDQRLLHQLDGDVAIVFDVLRKIDRRHPAAADFAKDAVAAKDGRGRQHCLKGIGLQVRLRALMLPRILSRVPQGAQGCAGCQGHYFVRLRIAPITLFDTFAASSFFRPAGERSNFTAFAAVMAAMRFSSSSPAARSSITS